MARIRSFLRQLVRAPLPALVLVVVPAGVWAQGVVPEAHTVRQGDTLWDLAQQYYGDPLLWPEIYRQNTMVVEDPHWIYPGEVLRLQGGQGVSAIPDEPGIGEAVPDADMMAVDARGRVDQLDAPLESGLFRRRSRVDPNQASLAAYNAKPSKPLSAGEFYSSGWLTEGQSYQYGQLLGPVSPMQINARLSATATIFTRVVIEAPSGGAYQVGDSLLTIMETGDVGGYGRVVVPTGLSRVIEIKDGKYVAEVEAVYNDIRSGQRVVMAEPFADPGHVVAIPVADGIQARFLASRDRQIFKGPLDVVFLDKGRSDGVALGDQFEIYAPPSVRGGVEAEVEEVLATVRVVHLGDRTATAKVMKVVAPDIDSGTPARQTAKIPS